MMMKQTQFKLDPEFNALNRPLSRSEYSALERSIVEEGCRDPLVVWKGLLLDGYHRYEICQKHAIEFKTTEAPAWVSTREDGKLFIIKNQKGRRNETKYEKIISALRLETFFAKEAERRKREAGEKYHRGHRKKVNQNSDKPINTLQMVAELADVSRDTVSKVKKIEALANKKTKAKLRAGDISISSAWLKVRSVELKKQAPETAHALPSDAEIEQEKINVLLKEGKHEELASVEWRKRLTRISHNILETRIDLGYLLPESDIRVKSQYKYFFETPVIKSDTEQVKFLDFLSDELKQIEMMVEEIERGYKHGV